MKILQLPVLAAILGTAVAQGSTEDADLIFHCQGHNAHADWRDQALDMLGKWCDSGNSVGMNQQARFNVHNTTAFICSYGDKATCTSGKVNRFVGGIKAYCPDTDQGGSCHDQRSRIVYGWSTVPRSVCGDYVKTVYEQGTLDPLPFPWDKSG